MSKNPHIGESFDSFLHDEGIYSEVKAAAIKRATALKVPHASLKAGNRPARK